MPSDANEAMGFQFGLVEPIGRAQAWVLSNEQIMDLENLTLGQERENVKQWHWSSPVELSINFFFEEHVMADINHQYSAGDIASLRSKLAQYPSGTKFWVTTSGPAERVAPVLQAINGVAAEHGLVVENAPPTD